MRDYVRMKVTAIIGTEWEELDRQLFSKPIEDEIRKMIDRIEERVENSPEIETFEMLEIGSRELKFTVSPGPGTLEEIVRIQRETGRVFIFTSANGDAAEMDLTFTPGNGLGLKMDHDPPPPRRDWWAMLRRWRRGDR